MRRRRSQYCFVRTRAPMCCLCLASFLPSTLQSRLLASWSPVDPSLPSDELRSGVARDPGRTSRRAPNGPGTPIRPPYPLRLTPTSHGLLPPDPFSFLFFCCYFKGLYENRFLRCPSFPPPPPSASSVRARGSRGSREQNKTALDVTPPTPQGPL